MINEEHPSDQRLLLDVDGELPPHDAKQVRAHLDGCWKCRTRRQELEQAITGFVHVYERNAAGELPPAAGPRASLTARMAQLSADGPNRRSIWFALRRPFVWALTAAACGFLAISVYLIGSSAGRPNHSRPHALIVSIPDSRLTPGAAVLSTKLAVCAGANTKNKSVPVALQRQVFEEYGIAGAEPRAYEVDYLVTPALGGADDIRNLWPHSYSSTEWNAQVKDALEDRLREMVCDGSLDLTEAQKEIAANWIGAYKKYFHTDKPLEAHYKQLNR